MTEHSTFPSTSPQSWRRLVALQPFHREGKICCEVFIVSKGEIHGFRLVLRHGSLLLAYQRSWAQ